MVEINDIRKGLGGNGTLNQVAVFDTSTSLTGYSTFTYNGSTLSLTNSDASFTNSDNSQFTFSTDIYLFANNNITLDLEGSYAFKVLGTNKLVIENDGDTYIADRLTLGTQTYKTNNKLNITMSNSTYTSSDGTNAHILLNNTSTTGQTLISSVINGSARAKIRNDFVGNMTYCTFGSGSAHYFNVNGDYGSGTQALYLDATQVITTLPLYNYGGIFTSGGIEDQMQNYGYSTFGDWQVNWNGTYLGIDSSSQTITWNNVATTYMNGNTAVDGETVVTSGGVRNIYQGVICI